MKISTPIIAAALLLLAAIAFSGLGSAVEPSEMLADPALEARARAISKELRCVVCQNQSIDDSNAPLAGDLRRLVRERLTQGDSDSQVLAHIVSRYGNFVRLRPPLQADTLLLWASPILFLAIALVIAAAYFRRIRRIPVADARPITSDEEMLVQSLVRERLEQ